MCAVAGGRLAVLGSAHTSPVGTLTPGGPGARPPLGGAAPPHGAAGLAKPRLKCLPPRNQLPLPPWPPLPAPAPPACATAPPPPPLLGPPTLVMPGGALDQCVLGCCPCVCVCVCFPLCPVGFLRPGGFALAVVPVFFAAPLCAVLPLSSRLLVSYSRPSGLLLTSRPLGRPLDFFLTFTVAGMSCGCGVTLRAPCGMICNASSQSSNGLMEKVREEESQKGKMKAKV